MDIGKEEKEKLKEFLEEYLNLKGINTKKLIRCFSPEHEDKHPSMSYYAPYKICKCFACHKTYTIFQLVGQEYGIQDYKKQIEKVKELYENRELIKNANETIYSKKNTNIILEDRNDKIEINDKEYSMKELKNYSDYIEKCKKNIYLTNYLEKRGISKEIQLRYNIGYDPHFKNGAWKAIIIPTDYGSFTARNTDFNSNDRLRKVGRATIFNYWELQIPENKNKDFFIVEGEIDALSIISAGQKAIALGSISNINILLESFKKDKPGNKFFLMLDNDIPGRKAENLLHMKLKEIEINTLEISSALLEEYKKYKDPNDFLIKDKIKFEDTINKISESYKINSNKKILPGIIKKKEMKKVEKER